MTGQTSSVMDIHEREVRSETLQEIKGLVRAKRAMYFSQTDSAHTLDDILRHLDMLLEEVRDDRT